MKAVIKHLIKIILIFVMIMCWGIAISYCDKVKSSDIITTIYLRDSGNNKLDFEDIKENITESFVSWKEKNNEMVSVSELNKTNNVTVLSIYGDSSLLIDGPVLFRDDIEGCLIDENTAFKLFGSTNVIGKTIEYGERNLIIRGFHKGERNLLVVESLLAERNEDDYFDGISMVKDKNTTSFIKNNGYENFAVDNSLYYSISKIIVSIFPLIILLFIIISIIKEVRSIKGKPVITILLIMLTLIISAIFFKVTRIKISIPVELLPNQWSDFDFWSEFYKKYLEKFKYIFYMKKYAFDRIYINNIIIELAYAISASTLFLLIKKYIKIIAEKNLFSVILMLLIFSFLTIVIVNNNYNASINTLKLWSVIPYYLISKFLIENISICFKRNLE